MVLLMIKDLIPILPKLFQNKKKKTKQEGTLPNSFYEASLTLISKPDKLTIKRENYQLISLMNKDANSLNKILSN